MKKNAVWISYDLGIKGDYEGMYSWLDHCEAKECGDSLAFFMYEHSGDILKELKEDLNNAVAIDPKKSRIYVIRLEDGKMKGAFIFGNRKSAPWTGASASSEQSEDNG